MFSVDYYFLFVDLCAFRMILMFRNLVLCGFGTCEGEEQERGSSWAHRYVANYCKYILSEGFKDKLDHHKLANFENMSYLPIGAVAVVKHSMTVS